MIRMHFQHYFNRQNGLILFALLIILFSVIYTNRLTKQISRTEKKMIDLYVKGLQAFISHNENDAQLTFLLEELMVSNQSVPVILADENGNPIDYRNLSIPQNYDSHEKNKLLRKEIGIMKFQHKPIEFEYVPGFKNVIYYKDSPLLTQLKYFPFILFLVISIFIILSYLVFNARRRAEQNRVWAGMAKETAHQLGTPLSSLMAWIEYMKVKPDLKDDIMISELEKDVEKLTTITERFSMIGSIPVLSDENIYTSTCTAIEYLQKRVSSKIIFKIETKPESEISAKINVPLFEWVIETVCKNSIDAMNGVGNITLSIEQKSAHVTIDIKDTGKGIPKNKFSEVFKPGFTTKKRGWGLGLSLAKRIVENYHNGKIFVLESDALKGTTMRILLK